MSILRDFLVAIGFDIDEKGEKQLNSSLTSATLKARLLSDALESLATRTVDALAGIAAKFDDLYFSSERTHASVQTLNAIAYAAEQTGSSVGEAREAIEHMAQMLRENRGNIYNLNKAGFGVNSATGELEYQLSLARQFQAMSVQNREIWGRQNGFSERFMQSLADLRFVQYMDEAIKSQKDSGLTPESARSANTAMTELRRSWMDIGNIADAGLTQLLKGLTPVLRDFNDFLSENHQAISDRIKEIVDAIVAFAESVENRLKRLDWDEIKNELGKFEGYAKTLGEHMDALTSGLELFFGLWVVGRIAGTLAGIASLGGALGALLRIPGLMPFLALVLGVKALHDSTTSDTNPGADGTEGGVGMPGSQESDGGGGGVWDGMKRMWRSRPGFLGGSGGGGGDAKSGSEGNTGGSTGKWWTPERMSHAVDRLQKEAGLSEMGAVGLVARWAGVESRQGPTSTNPISGAQGVIQALGSRQNEATAHGDYDEQLTNAIRELNGPEAKAAARLRAARTPMDGAVGGSMYERAEGFNGETDGFTAQTPVEEVLRAVKKFRDGATAKDAPTGAPAAPTPAAPLAGQPPVVFGDSIANGLATRLGADASNAVRGRTPKQVYDSIHGYKGSLAGRDVVISSGASNDPSQTAGYISQQIQEAINRGADPSRIRVLGVGTLRSALGYHEGVQDEVNKKLKEAAGWAKTQFVPLPPGTDVHPDYGELARSLQTPPPSETPADAGRTRPPGPRTPRQMWEWSQAHHIGGGHVSSSKHVDAPVHTSINIHGGGSGAGTMVAVNEGDTHHRRPFDTTRSLQGATA